MLNLLILSSKCFIKFSILDHYKQRKELYIRILCYSKDIFKANIPFTVFYDSENNNTKNSFKKFRNAFYVLFWMNNGRELYFYDSYFRKKSVICLCTLPYTNVVDKIIASHRTLSTDSIIISSENLLNNLYSVCIRVMIVAKKWLTTLFIYLFIYLLLLNGF